MTWKTIENCNQKNDQKIWPEELVGIATRKMTTKNCDQRNDLNLWPEKWLGKRSEIVTKKITWNYVQKNVQERRPGKWLKIATRKMTRNYDLSSDWEPKKWPGIATGKMTKNCHQKNQLKSWPEKWPGKRSEIAIKKFIRNYDQKNDLG